MKIFLKSIVRTDGSQDTILMILYQIVKMLFNTVSTKKLLPMLIIALLE